MPSSLTALDEAALALPPADRLAFAEKILASALAELPPELETAWDTEVQRRREEYLSGKTRLVPLEEVERSTARLLG